jgi:hypothetical protein
MVSDIVHSICAGPASIAHFPAFFVELQSYESSYDAPPPAAAGSIEREREPGLYGTSLHNVLIHSVFSNSRQVC